MLPTDPEHGTDGGQMLTCHVRLLGQSGLLQPEPGSFDVLVGGQATGSANSLRRVVANEASIAPKAPARTPISSEGGWSLRAYRCQKGYLALRCDRVPPACHVDSVSVGHRDIRVRARLLGTDARAERLVLRRRTDGATVDLPIVTTDVDVEVPLEEMSAAATQSGQEVWNVHVLTESGEIRVGRPLSDLENLTSSIRFDTLLYSAGSRRMTVRPYFSRDRFLSLEVEPLGVSASS